MARVNSKLYDVSTWPPRRIQRFLAFVKIGLPDECWPWLGSLTPLGHGRYRYRENGKEKSVLAHRMMWTLERGRVKPGFEAMHACLNLDCCNPWGSEHVIVGRAKKRIALLAKHERNNSGMRHPSARLTEPEVKRLLALKRENPELTGRQLAAQVGLKSWTWVNAILRGEGWKRVPELRRKQRRGRPRRRT